MKPDSTDSVEIPQQAASVRKKKIRTGTSVQKAKPEQTQAATSSTKTGKGSTKDDSDPPSAIELASLAIQLTQFNNSHRLSTINSEAYDEEFSNALERAEWMVKKAAHRKTSLVHAYRLFDQSEGLMSPEAVRQRFLEVGWNIGARNTVHDLAEEILGNVKDHIDRTEAAIYRLLQAREGISFNRENLTALGVGMVTALRDRFGLATVIKDVRPLSRRIVDVIIEMAEEELPTMVANEELAGELAAVGSFMDYVAPDRGKKSAFFRPYEVFLYAAQNSLLLDKLTKERSSLDPGFVPHRSYRSSIPIFYSKAAIQFRSILPPPTDIDREDDP